MSVREFQVIVKARDFSDAQIEVPATLRVYVYSGDVEGGPDACELIAEGTRDQLWQLIELLRCPIEIFDVEANVYTWWGYINEVQVPFSPEDPNSTLALRVSLSEMYNGLAVAYTELQAGAIFSDSQKETSFLTFDAGIREYGLKQLKAAMSNISDEQAISIRDANLVKMMYPIAEVVRGGDARARISCLGWKHTLDWTYLEVDLGLEENLAQDVSVTLGRENPIDTEQIPQKIEQRVQINSTDKWWLASISIPVATVNDSYDPGPPEVAETPFTDSLRVALYSDVAGQPGSLIASGTVAGTDIDSGLQWVRFTLNVKVEVTPAAFYHIHVDRTGAADDLHYYVVGVDSLLGYTYGVAQIWETSWVAPNPNFDLSFALEGVEPNSVQIQRIFTQSEFAPSSAPFVSTFLSTVYSNPYRAGDTRGLYELVKLLRTGNENAESPVFLIYRDRSAKLSLRPPMSDIGTVFMGLDGSIYAGEDKLPASLLPLARWRRFRGIDIAEFGQVSILNLEQNFIIAASYNAETDELDLITDGGKFPWEINFLMSG